MLGNLYVAVETHPPDAVERGAFSFVVALALSGDRVGRTLRFSAEEWASMKTLLEDASW